MQGEQARPPLPQAVPVVPNWHVPAVSQQPVLQVLAVQFVCGEPHDGATANNTPSTKPGTSHRNAFIVHLVRCAAGRRRFRVQP